MKAENSKGALKPNSFKAPKVVRVAGFEPTASWSRTMRATNCATPGCSKSHYTEFSCRCQVEMAFPRQMESGEITGDEAAADTAAGAEAEESGQTGEAEVSTLAYVLYSASNLPENVSLEQALLGFDYCTPVMGTLSSGFGYREHPVEGEERFHYGIDIAADTGTAIGCFADGTVTAVGDSSSYGKYLIVSHDGGFSTLYAHCSRITASSGQAVREGQTIAEVGETGVATGPHLHFELHQGDRYLNPIYYVALV